ncbi:Protein of unknown function [Propionibacterium freudenreichii]|uniref:Uncharacterized protein n=1 Tax=Propionibacterium freudenreichii subsp. freudenreichii TaxID=66712 RepID=A0A068VRM6_PROFF|nr:Protein of unknown function [Propionibacterium freudenreichii subsp. freudenreichii]CEG86977.1 Protein of unknown function [Propionibacterium freudenreichii]CEG88814.1 Protein of unknown function [Propionibacterium freudenreichii]CEG91685.1 Protein of unknown function [Propionibacterium freudenreichii]CEG94311.1 Protein of unknown function [Propionibacterium freudenreichii]
MRGRVRGKIET